MKKVKDTQTKGNVATKALASKSIATKTIAQNRKARHDYSFEQKFEAGIVLQGWELKSLRAGKVQIADSYVIIRKGEAYAIGTEITPLLSASTHVHPEPARSRKLLLHKKEITSLIGLTERKGYTLIPLTIYWKQGRVKVEIALAKGKKVYDKRDTEKERDWQKEKQRLFKKKIK